MKKKRPTFCKKCGRLAMLKIDNIPHCSNCAAELTESTPVSKIEKRAEPLQSVKSQPNTVPAPPETPYSRFP